MNSFISEKKEEDVLHQMKVGFLSRTALWLYTSQML